MPTINCLTGEVTYSEEELAAMADRAARATIPASITRRQCALQLRAMGTITTAEAKAMTRSAEVPAAVAQVFAGMTTEQQDLAEIDFAAVNYYRDNPLLAMMGLTEAELDQFFIAAAQL
jgi:hypothetical protein